MSKNRRKLGATDTEKRAVVQLLLSRALGHSAEARCKVVEDAVGSLTCLDDPTSEQVRETIGLVDGHLDLASRYNRLARAERERANDPEPTVDGDGEVVECCSSDRGEVSCAKARGFKACESMYPLRQTRVCLAAVAVLLEAASVPVGVKEPVPVPAATEGFGTTPVDPRRDRDRH